MEHLIRLFFKNFLDYKLIKIVHGHINETFQLILKTSEGEENWILQAVNTNVFKNLDILTNNSKVIAEISRKPRVQMRYILPHWPSENCMVTFRTLVLVPLKTQFQDFMTIKVEWIPLILR